MEIIDENKNSGESKTENKNTESVNSKNWGQNNDTGKIVGGLIIAGIGCIFLARELGAYIPRWLFSWQMLLIAIGVYSGIKSSFQNIGWLIMVLIGSAFLIRDLLPDYRITSYLWPIGLILVGLYIIVKPRNQSRKFNSFQNQQNTYSESSKTYSQYNSGTTSQSSSNDEEYIESDAVFGSLKKSVISKNFKGGEINCVFGGGEINMTQADFTGIIQLELNAVFGGLRIIVPSHWEIKSELTAVLGSVEDKRPIHRNITGDSNKFLILKGTAVFGGIEILSY